MFHELSAALQHVDAQLTAEEIADALWLANFMPASDSNATGPTENDQKDVISELPADAGDAKPARQQAAPEQDAPEPQRGNLYLRTGSGDDFQRGSLFRSPAAFALPNPLGLGRALRPFKRRVPSRTVFMLNEEETARRIAETKLWLPVLNAASTRWLEVALVIDEASSMAIWRQTLIELRLLLEREGAFRTVRTWGLVTDAADGKARLYAGTAREGRRECNPHELIDPGGRRLILVVTDGVSPAWDKKDGSVAKMLASWGRSTPVTIVQVLPQRLWRRTTALRAAVQVRLHALTPGPPNQQLAARPVYHWDAEEASTGIKVPVVTLESRSLLNWARAIARAEDIWIPGYVFNPNAAQDNGNINAPAPPEPKAAPLSAEERVNRFRASASPAAYKLAGLLSTVPVSLPIIRLIQQIMLPQSLQMHAAEVLLGGLFREVSPVQAGDNPDYIEYEFIDGVRELLFDSLKVNEAVETIEILSNFIEKRLGQSSDFLASLPNPYGAETLPIKKEARRFARIAASVLHRLGGSYAQLAESYEEVADEIDGQVPEPAPVDSKSPDVSQDQDKIGEQVSEPSADQVQNNQFGTTEEIEEAVGKVAEPQISAYAEQESIAEEEDIAGKFPDPGLEEVSDKVRTFPVSSIRRVLILTALRVEYMAVRAYLSDIYEVVYLQGIVYERGIFSSPGGRWEVILGETGAGNISAAMEAERAIEYFQPGIVLLVGIADGFKDVKTGDVVVANKVYGYESGKMEGDRFIPRPDVGESSYTLLLRTRVEARSGDWLRRIRSVQPGESAPEVFVGPIASGEKVIPLRSDIYQFLSTYYSDTLAVDMEGRGVLRATHTYERVQALIIRGISNLINEPRKEDFQKVAADHASAFAFEVLAKLPVDESSQNPQTQPDDAQLKSQAAPVAASQSVPVAPLRDATAPFEVFISYSEEDERYAQRLQTHLIMLKRQMLITDRFVDRLTPGSESSKELMYRLNAADIILLLISPYYLASEQHYVELERAMERQRANEAKVIPILVRPTVGWQDAVRGLQSLPMRGKAITQWRRTDEAFAEVAEEIKAIVIDLRAERTQKTAEPAQEQRNADQDEDTNISWTHLQQISPQEKRQLVDKLLACPTMSDRRSRDTMLGLLDRQITHSIARSSIERVDVMNIVDACLAYSHGIQSLIDLVRNIEGDSQPMGQLDSFLMDLSR